MSIVIFNIMEIINKTGLAGLCFSFQHCDYMDTKLCVKAFSYEVCRLKLDPHAFKAGILLTAISKSDIS